MTSLIQSSLAISRLLVPRATSCNTCISRPLRFSSGGVRVRSINREVTVGARIGRPLRCRTHGRQQFLFWRVLEKVAVGARLYGSQDIGVRVVCG